MDDEEKLDPILLRVLLKQPSRGMDLIPVADAVLEPPPWGNLQVVLRSLCRLLREGWITDMRDESADLGHIPSLSSTFFVTAKASRLFAPRDTGLNPADQ